MKIRIAVAEAAKRLGEKMGADAIDAARYRKLMDLAVYGGTYKGEHVWRFKPIMGPHRNLHNAIDQMGECHAPKD